jgi:hypothetical protein
MMPRVLLVLLIALLAGMPACAQPSRPSPETPRNIPGAQLASQKLKAPSAGNVLRCNHYASLQGCHDALPPAGGKMLLPADTTMVQSFRVTIRKPNVTIECPSWATVIQRSTTLNDEMLYMPGEGSTIINCTIDGNGVNNTVNVYADLDLAGTNSVGSHVRAINGRAISIAVDGTDARLTGSTIIGIGTSTLQTYGVWAIAHKTVMIDHNTISGTGIDGIGFDGPNTQVVGNHLFNIHCYTGIGGGAIAQYSGTGTTNGDLIEGNTIDTGCATNSSGLELNGNNTSVVGNVIQNQYFLGAIAQAGHGYLFSGNLIRNSSYAGVNAAPGLQINPGVSHVVISGANRIIDDQATPTQRWGILIQPGASDYIEISGNEITGNVTAQIADAGTGLHKSIQGNVGVDGVIPSVASAAKLEFPINPSFRLTGTSTVDAIRGDVWLGRQVTILPEGVVTFAAGNNIGNSVTTTPNVPVTATYDGSLWHLK